MTEKEIIEVLDNTIDLLYDMEGSASNFSNVNRCNDTRHKLEDVVKQMQEPHLSSGLDEAAEEYYDEMWDELGGKAMVVNYEHDIWYPSSVIETVFKAGAKWMAEQGESFYDVVEDDEYMGYTLGELIWDKAILVNKFKPGDKVIVQIRKA